MLRVILVLCTVIYAYDPIAAQDFNNYQAARCQGPPPKDFLKSSGTKAKEAVRAVKTKNLGRRESLQEQSYEVSANFLVDELLSSGQVLFGDSMSHYVNHVADILLADDPELRSQLRFYVYRSHVPNAYATHTGVILISIGLLARVENEAQIACILAHEVQHFVKKHSLQQFKKSIKLRDRGNISMVEMDSRLKEYYRFSKDAESEADMLGFELLKKTKYNMHEGIAVFEMLRYVEYPFLETSLTLDSFESEHYKYPDALRKEIDKELEKKTALQDKIDNDEEDDENSTHPSLTKRINKLKDMLEEDNIPNSGELHLISKDKFDNIQRMARCELLGLYIRRADFGNTLYLVRVMELVYGPTLYTDKIKAMSWYGLAFHRMKRHSLVEYGCDLQKSRGDWRPLKAMLREMKSKELVALSMRELYLGAKKYPGNAWFANLRDQVFVLAQTEDNFHLNDFVTYTPKVAAPSLDTAQKKPEAGGGAVRNPRTRSQERGSEKAKNGEYYYAVFYDFEQKDTLAKYLKSIAVDVPENTNTTYIYRSKKKVYSDTPRLSDIAIFQPDYEEVHFNGRGIANSDYFIEERMENMLEQDIETYGKIANMNVHVISGRNKESLTTEEINQHMVINDWFIERTYNDTNTMFLWNAAPVQNELLPLGTTYLGWMGFRYRSERREFDPMLFVGSLVLYPTFPLYLIWQLGYSGEFRYVSVVFDTRTGSIQSFQKKTLSHKLKTDFLNTQVYRIIYNIQYEVK